MSETWLIISGIIGFIFFFIFSMTFCKNYQGETGKELLALIGFTFIYSCLPFIILIVSPIFIFTLPIIYPIVTICIKLKEKKRYENLASSIGYYDKDGKWTNICSGE